ncbi:glycosyltransferase [Kocuria rhizophila]|uniref:glycosyltransferase family protein n=1 Tax=Kocuria rhizophila TaxID=72000 RepID=UPI00215024C9|nr:glycosyltransferase [Kocuria rhizophila]MCR4524891.1 glycosyltransferase [Kocuria rhizophila]
MTTVNWRHVVKHAAVPAVVGLLAIMFLCMLGSFAGAVVVLVITVCWGAVVAQLAVNRQMLFGQNRTLGRLETLIQGAAEHSAVDPDKDALVRALERRQRRMEKTLNDIAGTVGRSAPRIRAVESLVSRSVPLASTVSSGSSAVPVKAAANASSELFPPVHGPAVPPAFEGVKVAVVADEFTAKAFAYEWNTFEPTPDNWRQQVDEELPDVLFVESAWEANGGAWRYHLVGPSAPRPAITELVAHCQEKGIPTVFWNKEDPPHFEDFLPTAALFDHVYTTDENLVPEYRQRLGHDRIRVLPFAAQPKLHNPGRVGRVQRDRSVVFGGMYFRDKYPERREQLDVLLPAAARLDLDIYSRQDGEDPKYRFPEQYAPLVRGNLPYSQMITAYHAYKVVLNVNSVVDSQTMCARRIFEATACGAAVVTVGTPAIHTYFPGGMLTEVTDENDAYFKMRSLVRSPEYRDRKVHVAQRHVLENHTYRHRARAVMRDLGLSVEEPPRTHSFFVSTNRPKNLPLIFANVGRQNVTEKQLVLLTHGFGAEQRELEELANSHGIQHLVLLQADRTDSLGRNLNRLTAACDGDVLFRMDDDDYYGPNYARDLATALEFTGAALAGKAATYIYFEETNDTVLTYETHENRFTDFVRGATFCGPRSTFSKYQFPELENSEDSAFLTQVLDDGARIYSADRFNFVVERRAHKASHTWRVADEQLFSTGVVKFKGNSAEQVVV